MDLTFDQIHKYFEVRHPDQHIPTRDKVSVHCANPAHEDRTASCTLFLEGHGGFNCHACGAKGGLLQFEMMMSKCTIEQARINIAKITGATLGGDNREYIATYYFLDHNRIPASRKNRYRHSDGKKSFTWEHYDSAGRWRSGLAKETPRLLYNHPNVTGAHLVLWFEGEKDCDTASALVPLLWPERTDLNIVSTCNPEGAWEPGVKPKWQDSYDRSAANKDMVIFEDNDPSGKTLADYVCERFHPFAHEIRRVAFPGQREKYDFTDWVEEHDPETLIADFRRMIETATLWKPAVQKEQPDWFVEAVNWASSASPEVDWLIDGVIQADANGIIAAEPKTGKSLVALDLLISLATGQRWLGRKVKRRVRCAYISREDSPILTKARVRGFMNGKGLSVDPSEWLWINTREQLGSFDIDDNDQLEKMASDLEKHGVEFAILDVLNRIHSRNENDNTLMVGVVERISEMGRKAGCSIGLVHHVSKENGSGGRFFTRIRGASAIHGWTEWSIGLTLENPNNEGKKLIRKAEFESKAGESAPLSFTVEFGGSNLCLQLMDPMVYDSPGRDKGAPYRRQ